MLLARTVHKALGTWGCLTRHMQRNGAKLAAPQVLCHSDDVVTGISHAHTRELDGAIVKRGDSAFVAFRDVGLSPWFPFYNLLHGPIGCVPPFNGRHSVAGVLNREQDVFLYGGIDGGLRNVQ